MVSWSQAPTGPSSNGETTIVPRHSALFYYVFTSLTSFTCPFCSCCSFPNTMKSIIRIASLYTGIMHQINPVVIAWTELPCPPLSDVEKQPLMLNAQRVICKLYQDGVPFFTKAIFRNIVLQFDQATTSTSYPVRITDLNNTEHEFPIETGNVYPYHSPPDNCIYIR